ncbi:MAG: hypothetical protein M1829_000999 [Trizodia sp. TS-e1964]|nr:MAG: hypothetical protein M1829_000999 [Trizodia sp. TS-e1964]
MSSLVSKSKRKAASAISGPLKKPRAAVSVVVNSVSTSNAEVPSQENGYVLREFYPPEMSNERAQQYIHNQIPRPIEELTRVVKETEAGRAKIKVKDAVVHWFKWDLRLQDNRALSLAAKLAEKSGIPLICLYILSPQDFRAHLTAPVRVDFILRTLDVLKRDLAKLDIPLHVETVERRKAVPERIVELAKQWGANHVYTNMLYEVDELRRETLLTRRCLDHGIALHISHDTCVVDPGNLITKGTGTPYAVYTPWYKAWMAYIHQHSITLKSCDSPGKNPVSATKLFKSIFDSPIPDAPAEKALSKGDKTKFKSMWPAGEHEAHVRLEKFIAERIGAYGDARNFPFTPGTSSLSVHFAAGTLAARTAIRLARAANSTVHLDGGSKGIVTWISEVAWRDFYKHVLVHWPFVCMNKPFKPAYTNIQWEYSDSHFAAWCAGKTGFPIVDAAMRQLNHTGYMHNRCRMIVASFLSKDLLLDWRLGERYFMENLIDGDFASNNGGWGWSASVGVDPQPYFRIFNPLSQSEKFDPKGEYIRKWVPELKDITGKAIHDPYGKTGEARKAEKAGYPRPIVVHDAARKLALQRYKEGLDLDKKE